MDEERPASFEQMAARLEAIVKELESGGTDLDRAVALFKEGKALARACEQLLKGAQTQIDRAMETSAPAEGLERA
jgi:exodeoxyribonuclease VII small subunit